MHCLNKKHCGFMIEFIAFIITLTIPGYLLIEKHFTGIQKAILSVFLSLSVTSFLYYFIISFFGISKELIYVYFLLLLALFIIIKKPSINAAFNSIQKIKLKPIKFPKNSLPDLLVFFLVVLVLSLAFFLVFSKTTLAYDDTAYHLPITNDIADDGQKTFFSETYNIYQVRSNQFPLLFESFAGATKFLLQSNIFKFTSFFSVILSLFLIFFISRLMGYNEFFSAALFALTPVIVIFTRFFHVDLFLSMFFLGSVFFVLNYVKTEKSIFLIISAFLAGLMFLTKFTGAIFFAGLFLFLLYKREFKASFLFALIFVLIFLVFVVSHFNVPVEAMSIGGYSSFIAESPFVQIPFDVFETARILFYYFFHNLFIFFIPFLFLFGLFLIKKNENDFFLLFMISSFLFFLVVFVNGALPNNTAFPRFFLPVYALLCIFSGVQLKKLIFLNNKIFSFFVVLLFFSASFTSFQYLGTELSKTPEPNFEDLIDNDPDTVVWFVNGSAFQIGLENATLCDYVWRPSFSGNPCAFLREHEIDYVVYFYSDKEPDLFFNGNFSNVSSPETQKFAYQLKHVLFEEQCAELLLYSDSVPDSVLFKIN